MTSPQFGTMTSPRTGEPLVLTGAAARQLRGALQGELILPGGAAYDQARSVWNGMIDRRPAAAHGSGSVAEPDRDSPTSPRHAISLPICIVGAKVRLTAETAHNGALWPQASAISAG